MTAVGCVILSRGDRPDELTRAVEAVLAQRNVDVDVVVVGNGWQPSGLPGGARSVALETNVGVPEGRNIGAHAARGDVLFFLDDDATPVGTEFLTRAVQLFDDDPRVGVVQPRSVDPTGGATAPRHVPRIGGRGVRRAGDVAWFWEGASLIRRSAFELAGGWPGDFFYGHEGIELAWRVIDGGYRVRYEPDLGVLNPPAAAFRGEQHGYLDARNRIWVARRNLPAVFAALYCLVWVAATLARAPDAAGRRTAMRGFRDGVRLDAGPRRPIRWRTCWTLTRLGRPPIV